MAKELFGTDGIRGVAGEFPLDPPTAYTIGVALGGWALRRAGSPEVLIGMDTRESGRWLAEHLAGGLHGQGVRCRFAGVITTPGVACLTKQDGFVAGVMISASHNPYQDNGIKVFGHTGYKLPDAEEHLLEQEILRPSRQEVEPRPLTLAVDPGLDERYLEYLASTSGGLEGFSILADCGNGAASDLGPKLFTRLGASVTRVACAPNGRNINLDCGALYIDKLAPLVAQSGVSVGVAFDGDADRAMFVSPSGRVVNGDSVLLLCARWLRSKGQLSGNNGLPVVVSTVMANLGLEKALGADGIAMIRTAVGDKYVLEEMLRQGAVLGGEQSGHVIFSEHATTGDGLLTALRVFEVMRETGRNLDELTADLKVFPQELVNVRVRTRKPLDQMESVRGEIRAAEEAIGSTGRVVVRFSGTEPLARVMVEGEDGDQVHHYSERIADAIRRELGG